jgi:glutamate synthase (NADPH) small chain
MQRSNYKAEYKNFRTSTPRYLPPAIAVGVSHLVVRAIDEGRLVAEAIDKYLDV